MKKIINIAMLAHVDAGKTTLTEELLYLCGAIRTKGTVDDGTAQTDFLEIERERGISVKAAQTTIEYQGVTVNLIDTPGHVDFAGEVERSLLAVDGAVLLVSAVEGIQANTENIWRALKKLSIPTVVFINKVDRAGSRIDEIERAIREELGAKATFIYNKIENEGEKTCSETIPSDNRERMLETVADFCDEAADAYLLGDTENEEIEKWFGDSVGKCEIVPIVCGSASFGIGIKTLLQTVVSFIPPKPIDSENELCALVYRIEHDKTMGRIAHVRLFGGELSARDVLSYPDGKEDGRPDGKISQIRKFNGQKYIDVGTVKAGDVAALCGLSEAKVFDWFGKKPPLEEIGLANPYLCVKVSPKKEEELTALVKALEELEAEDPLLGVKWEKGEREILINITGKVEIEILSRILEQRFGLETEFSNPSVIYKETPSSVGEGIGVYTMPKPCWAIVKFRFEPLPRGSGVVYDGGNISSDKLFYRYQEHIRRSFFESLEQGLFGWEVTDFKATLVDGEHHTIHTHPLDFFVATPMAFMNTLVATKTTLLEPFLKVRIKVGEEFVGKVISDIIKMRGEFDSPKINGSEALIEALLPVATSMEYPITLASMTGGRGYWSATFDSYKECPIELGATTEFRGVNPLDRSKWILYKRGAY